MSGLPFSLQSSLKPIAMSHSSGCELLLQSALVPAWMSHSSGTALALQSASHSSGISLLLQSLLVPADAGAVGARRHRLDPGAEGSAKRPRTRGKVTDRDVTRGQQDGWMWSSG